mmetsp:Transcript_19061/g.44824  ORF Transcript_19061/g.44824 Transcript_19061/m.44824 type:complete len:230 (-) Transcript_19061:874-1563(-)
MSHLCLTCRSWPSDCCSDTKDDQCDEPVLTGPVISTARLPGSGSGGASSSSSFASSGKFSFDGGASSLLTTARVLLTSCICKCQLGRGATSPQPGACSSGCGASVASSGGSGTSTLCDVVPALDSKAGGVSPTGLSGTDTLKTWGSARPWATQSCAKEWRRAGSSLESEASDGSCSSSPGVRLGVRWVRDSSSSSKWLLNSVCIALESTSFGSVPKGCSISLAMALRHQ